MANSQAPKAGAAPRLSPAEAQKAAAAATAATSTETPEQKAAKAAANKAERVNRFKKIAANRTIKILKTLDNLGNCSTAGNYEYTPEQVKTIFNSIKDKVAEIEGKFATTAKSEKNYNISL